MIAIVIMVVSFAAITMVQSNSIQATIRAKEMTIVGMLARQAMARTETEIRGKVFGELPQEFTEDFPEPYENFRWKRTVEEVELPNLMPSSGDGEQGNQQAEMVAKMVTKNLSKSMRKITVMIEKKNDPSEKSYSLTTYWVNLVNDFQLSP